MTKRYFGVGFVVAVVGGAACFVACSSDPDATPGPGVDAAGTETGADTGTPPPADGGVDSATPMDAGTDTGTCASYTGALPNDAGAQCHDLASTATAVAVIADPGTIPVGTGGTLGDGLYHLTEVRAYAGSPVPAGTMLKYTLLVAGDTSYIVDDNGPTTVRRTTKKNPDGGAGIIVCETKADNNPAASTATATCSSFTTYDSNSKFSAKFVKQ
jgi:hypothetical protein